MADAIIYVGLSMLEGFAIIFFSFNLFKVDLKFRYKEITLTVFLMSVGAFTLKHHEMIKALTPSLSFILLFLCLLFYFKLSMIDSIKLAFTGYMSLGLVELVGINILKEFMAFESVSAIQADKTVSRFIQIVSVIIVVFLGQYIRVKRKNYTTGGFTSESSIRFNKLSFYFLVIVLAGFILLFSIYRFNNFFLEIIFWIICIMGYWLIEEANEKKDYKSGIKKD
ncbi:hypothetical protein F4V43_02170 [Paenibacillus spiritus]|uniref:Uncharacterized protein n=1 Tax=Paenibacillus spiritus TaxID=2496557 RepID=A0A5J5GHW9_9BACL|nr:hypothetical protein [Paenibacillus spiritus]KAA9007313.1 hypothetical protein F4V43_02170 [Paenibacillus spiritus]